MSVRREDRVDVALARRREHRDRIELDPEARERMQHALAALGLTTPNLKEKP